MTKIVILAFESNGVCNDEMAINSIFAEVTASRVNTGRAKTRWKTEFNFCLAECQIIIPTYMQPTELVSGHFSELQTIETNCNVVESLFSMATQGLLDTLLGKPHTSTLQILSDEPGNLPNFMIVTFVSHAPAGII